MAASVDAVRSASRMRRYDRLRREQDDSFEVRLVAALFVWGVPALAPVAAVLAVATGRDSDLVEVGLGLGVALLAAHLMGRPRFSAFDLLHQPSRRGLVLGHALRRLPRLAWSGVAAVAAWLILMPWLTHRVGGVMMLAAVALAPTALALNAGAVRLARRTGEEEAAWLLPLLLPVIGAVVAAERFRGEAWAWALPALGAVVGVAIVVRAGALLSSLRQSAALVLVVLVIGLAAAPRGPAFTDDSLRWLAAGAAGLLAAGVVLVVSMRTQLRCIETVEVIQTRADGDEGSPSRSGGAAHPLRRELSGTGLWKARLRYAREEWLPDEVRGSELLGAWAGTSMILFLTVFRGPVLAAVAVALAGPERCAVWLAVLAGCLASRAVAVDALDLQPRLWMMGVDYRTQVLHGLRALLAFAALPTLLVALVALAVAGPADAGRQATVLVVAATLLLRAGLPGLWPLQETHRMRLVLVWGVLLAAVIAFEVWWTPLEATYAAAGAGAAGVLLLVARLLRLREPRVVDRVRRAGET